MIALTAADVAAATGGRLHPAALDSALVVHGPVVVDSRLAQVGSLFVALPGETSDGHDHAAAAVAAGAALILAARPVPGPDGVDLPSVVVDDVERALGALAAAVLLRLRTDAEPGPGPLTVVGVTGSVGKTTTKDLLAQLLAPSGATVWPVASFNNEIGLPLTVLRADADTRFLVLEMGASGLGQLTYLTGIAPPDIAVVLAVGSAHIGEFGGVEAIARAKAEIVAGLATGGTAVLNADDARVAAMAAGAPGDVLTFGGSVGAGVRASDITVDRAGRAAFTLTVGDDAAPVTLRLVGEHHVSNALAAAAVATLLGLSVAEIATRLSIADALSPHRMHVVDRADGVTVIDDSYNANPDSMRAALKALATVAGRDRRSVAVLGEMLELGPQARSEHEAIGLMIVRLNVALTVVVGPGAHAIADGAMREGSWGDEVAVADDVDVAGDYLEAELRPGDVVLVKSSYGAGLWRLGDRLLDAAATQEPVG
ncbi:UDP-N-acetylmuramoyl-tripeptide--D-alanyl-D-alanine ligase [Pengzhenrongella sicca]|uniref:UDP-N-acetylmuramoyl-tripeptide--D-alanyl-D-alanine ligase n=1 Tax=Pengzhenrongella sicca TaxID=2819238 RepID=A0A8A4ZJH9_9MICO|nr:UDP-N-acetylmuramoyl-tripeptide--D-alanyl-D-alanine ligase [Pengzhenrongella sicca]QTE30656.1 UDP-N-acetylmuramoyl-tripeptide--D-alanyl-D-alanine ligase [Pengzhenrongella sicca]